MLSTPYESVQICTDPDRYSRIFRNLTSQKTVLKLKLQPHSFINTSTNPDGSHMYKYIRQIGVNIAYEPLIVEQQLLESSSEIDKLPCKTYTKHSTDSKITFMGTIFPAQESWVLEIFNWLSLDQQKYLLQKPKNAINSFPEAPRKKFLNNLYGKSLNILKDPCRSAVVLT